MLIGSLCQKTYVQLNFTLQEIRLQRRTPRWKILKRATKESGRHLKVVEIWSFSAHPHKAALLPSCKHGRILPIEPSPRLPYPSGQQTSFLLLVTALDMEDTERGQISLPSCNSQFGGDTDSSKKTMRKGPTMGLSKP